jgi:hypothetical protein
LAGEDGGAGRAGGLTAAFLWHAQRSISDPSSRHRLLFVM